MEINDREQWLAALQPGDRVAIRLQVGILLRRVASRSPKVITLQTGERYDSQGRLIGAGVWDQNFLEEVTPEILEEIKRRRLIADLTKQLRSLELSELSTQALEELSAVLKKFPTS